MVELKKSYRFLRGVAKVFTHKMTTVWEEPYDGEAAIFCPNHAGVWGPVDMCVHFDLRDEIRPWFNADVADEKLMPAYVLQDYWWKPGCRMEPLYKRTIPYLAAAVLPPIMRTAPGIKVYHDNHVFSTFRESVQAVKNGENLVIFPEQPDGYGSHCVKINEGWLLLGPMLYKKLGVNIKIYPVHVDHKNHVITVRKPVRYDGALSLEEQKEQLLAHIAEGLKPKA